MPLHLDTPVSPASCIISAFDMHPLTPSRPSRAWLLALLLAGPAARAGTPPPDLGPLRCEPFQTIDTVREDGAPEPAATRPRAHFALVADRPRLLPYAQPDALGLRVSATALRTPAERLQLSAALQRRSQAERPDGIVPTRMKAATGFTGAAIFEQRLDADGSLLRGAASATLGHLRLDGDWATADAMTARAAGPYGKVTFDLAQQQRVEGPLSLYTRVAGQWSSKNLDPSEKLGLGGPGGVRTFNAGAAAGDRGWLAQWEARLRVAASATAFVFADHGRAAAYAEPWDAASAGARTLSAAGIGLRHAVQRWSVETAVSRPVSDAPRFTAQIGLKFD